MIHLINRQPTTILDNQSPYFYLYNKSPDYLHLRIFGCVCFVILPPRERNKLSAKVTKCVFVGHSDKQKGYICYDPHHQRMRVSCHVTFFENVYYYGLSPNPTDYSSSNSILCDFSDSQTKDNESMPIMPLIDHGSEGHVSTSSIDKPTPNPPPLKRSIRINFGKPPTRYSLFTSLNSVKIPSTFNQAIEQACWRRDMEKELAALKENHTWDLVPRPPHTSIIGSKWVYNIKVKSDGSLDRYKARLVGQGYKQEYGIDYEETFASWPR